MYDAIFLGGGAGGYIGAVTSASMGLRVAVVERSGVGGMCVNYGCIPTDSALWVTSLQEYGRLLGIPAGKVNLGWKLDRAKGVAGKVNELATEMLEVLGVDLVTGEGSLVDHGVKVAGKIIESKAVVLATGARYDLSRVSRATEGSVITAREFWDISEVPKGVALIQGGFPSIRGIELAELLALSGSDVEVIDENAELFPQFDADLMKVLREDLEKRGLRFHMGVKDVSVENNVVNFLESGERRKVEFDKLIPSYAWLPNTEGLGLNVLGVQMKDGFVVVDESCRTNLPWLYGVGEVTSAKGATKAMYMGKVAAFNISGHPLKVNQSLLPSGIFTIPQFAYVGMSEELAKRSFGDPVIGMSEVRFNEKAIAMGAEEGLVKLVFSPDGRFLGGGVVSYDAEEMISILSLALRLGAKAEDLALSGYEHASLAESVQAAASSALSRLSS